MSTDKKKYRNCFSRTAQSIAEDDFSLYHGTKSDILKRLNNIPKANISGSSNNAILFDLLAFIRVKTYSNCKNFNEFALLLYQHFSKLSEGYNCCKILILNGFSEHFLRNSKNKEDLGIFLSNEFMEFHKTSQDSVVTIKDTVASNKTDIATDSLIVLGRCRFKADQTQHKSMPTWYKKVIINTVDTDVLTLAIPLSNKLVEYSVESEMLKLEMCDNAKFYNILQLRDTIWHEQCLRLPFLHALTGCDSNYSFYRQGKCKFWDRWMKSGDCHNITETFTVLSNATKSIDETQIVSIENYLMPVFFLRSVISTQT